MQMNFDAKIFISSLNMTQNIDRYMIFYHMIGYELVLCDKVVNWSFQHPGFCVYVHEYICVYVCICLYI